MKVVRRYRYVSEDRDRHGNVRVYLRLPGQPKVRLRAEPGTPAFDELYRRAIAGESLSPAPPPRDERDSRPRPGSLREFCIAYYGSADFRRLSRRTQHVRRLILDKLCAQHGNKPAESLEPKHVRSLRDARPDKPEAGNAIVKALRAVFHVAMESGRADANPAKQVSYRASGSPGFHTWTDAEVRQFEAHHPIGTMARLALALLLYTGQRRSDVVRFGPAQVHDGLLVFRQLKTGAELVLPIVPALQQAIDATACGADTFLVTEFRRPFTADGFGNRFRAWCDDAGLRHCSAHGLRKAAATRLAEAGASSHEIAAVTGHRTLKEVARYTAAADQRRLAQRAFARLYCPTPNPQRGAWDELDRKPLKSQESRDAKVPRGGIEPPTLRFSVACSTN
jgi:integrase